MWTLKVLGSKRESRRIESSPGDLPGCAAQWR